jgi:hypothetical protein
LGKISELVYEGYLPSLPIEGLDEPELMIVVVPLRLIGGKVTTARIVDGEL